jgi:hypothetical protein
MFLLHIVQRKVGGGARGAAAAHVGPFLAREARHAPEGPLPCAGSARTQLHARPPARQGPQAPGTSVSSRAPVRLLGGYARTAEELSLFLEDLSACAPAKHLDWEDALEAVRPRRRGPGGVSAPAAAVGGPSGRARRRRRGAWTAAAGRSGAEPQRGRASGRGGHGPWKPALARALPLPRPPHPHTRPPWTPLVVPNPDPPPPSPPFKHPNSSRTGSSPLRPLRPRGAAGGWPRARAPTAAASCT